MGTAADPIKESGLGEGSGRVRGLDEFTRVTDSPNWRRQCVSGAGALHTWSVSYLTQPARSGDEHAPPAEFDKVSARERVEDAGGGFAGSADETGDFPLGELHRQASVVRRHADGFREFRKVDEDALFDVAEQQKFNFLLQFLFAAGQHLGEHAPHGGAFGTEAPEDLFRNDDETRFLKDFGCCGSLADAQQSIFAKNLSGADEAEENFLVLLTLFDNLHQPGLKKKDRIGGAACRVQNRKPSALRDPGQTMHSQQVLAHFLGEIQIRRGVWLHPRFTFQGDNNFTNSLLGRNR